MAIDPPYRLDPFQNIIAVNWTTETIIEQKFIFRRWVGDPVHNGWHGDYYPITEEFFQEKLAAGEIDPNIVAHPWIVIVVAERDLLSELINAGLTLSMQYLGPGSPELDGMSFNIAWSNINSSPLSPVVQPSRSETRTWVYTGIVKGVCKTDDMSTADWAALPEFIPP